MDLGTVSEKLDNANSPYYFVEDVLDHIQLIWDNCKRYNPPTSVHIVLCSGYMGLLINFKDHSRKWLRIICPTYQLQFQAAATPNLQSYKPRKLQQPLHQLFNKAKAYKNNNAQQCKINKN